MIGSLTGIVDETADGHAVIDVHGVGYTVFASQRLLATLETGEAVKLSIETQVREDHIHLFGFHDNTEREWFRLLTSVQRLGPRMALAILSALAPAQILHAILAKDTAAFSRISGVGAKLAERIVTELKEKAVTLPVGDGAVAAYTQEMPARSKRAGATAAMPARAPTDDAVSALVNLGYARGQAYSAALKANAAAGADASLDELIKLSLKELA